MQNQIFIDIRGVLKNEMYTRIEKNPSYSLRAFARDLNIDHGTLSQVMSGKRTLTLNNYLRMEPFLPLDDSQKQQVRREIGNEMSDFTTYREEQIVAMDKWYHSALLELMETVGHQSNAEWMASRLGMTPGEVKVALENLHNLGMIKMWEGKWIPTDSNTTTLKGTQMESLALAAIVQDVQSQFFQKQIDSLENIPYEKMSHYGLTFALDPAELPLFRQKLLTLLRDMNRQSDAHREKKREVYRLNLSLFPLSIADQE